MSKGQARKATFKDLLARKLQKEQDQVKVKDIYVSSMDATLTFTKPSDDQILDVIDLYGDGADTRKVIEAFKPLIYNCCPMLQDTELHKELGVADPFDTVDALFDLADKIEIGEQLMDMTNIGGRVEALKNS